MNSSRSENYKVVSEIINCSKNIDDLIQNGHEAHKGIGGTAVKIEINGIPVFVKQVPVTNLEMDNMYCTKNLFNLPIYYQYGVGSTGFGVWRELEAHQMTTNWILKGECENFPITYGYKIVKQKNPQNINEEDLKKYVEYWGSSSEIADRMKAISSAKYSLYIFMEFIPKTLHEYVQNDSNANLKIMENDLRSTVNFMNSKGMIHFDGHGRNILTNGKNLYFADFGLVNCLDFDLTTEEKDFMNKHKTYDLALGIDAVCHALEKSTNPEKNEFLKNYLPISEKFHEFIMDLRHDNSKSINYPEYDIDAMLNENTIS